MKTLSIIAAVLISSAITHSYATAESPRIISKTKLGVIVPLTGPLAFFGKAYVHALEVAKQDHPDLEDLLEVRFEDSAYDSKQAISAFNTLVSVHGADIVVSFGGPMLAALAPIAESKKIPFFATESEKKDCIGRNYCSLLRNEADEWGEATWKTLRKDGKTRIGIVKNQNQFMNTFVDAIVRTKRAEESVEILSDIPPDVVDIRSEISSWKSTKVDALGVFLLPGSHTGLLRAMKDLKMSVPVFGVEQFLVPEMNRGFEEITDGAFVVAPAAKNDYRARFEDKFGFSAGFFYTPAFYDFLLLLGDTVRARNGLNGLELVRALRFEGRRDGVSGQYSVRTSTDGVTSYSFPIAVYRVSQGVVSIGEIIEF